MAGMYAVYHGPEGIRAIAAAHRMPARALLAEGLRRLGYAVGDGPLLRHARVRSSMAGSRSRHREPRHADGDINFRCFVDGAIGIALDETTTAKPT